MNKMHCKHVTLGLVLTTLAGILVVTVCLLLKSSSKLETDGPGESGGSSMTDTEKLSHQLVSSLVPLLKAQCESYSHTIWDHKLGSGSANDLNVYLESQVNDLYFLTTDKQVQVIRDQLVHARITEHDLANFNNASLASTVRFLLHFQRLEESTTTMTNSYTNKEYRTLLQLQYKYRERLESVYIPYQQQVSEFEEWEQDNLGRIEAMEIHKRRIDLNHEVWTGFYGKFGQYVQHAIAPDMIDLERRRQSTDKELLPQLDTILDKLRPLYILLHAYVRGTAQEMVPSGTMAPNGSIPVHLISPFGNWFHYKDDVVPFDQLHMGHVTFNIMNDQELQRPIELVQLVNRVFDSLDLDQPPKSTWNESVFITNGRNDFDFDGAMRRCDDDDSDFNICEDDRDARYRTMFCDGNSYENFRDFHRKLGTIRFIANARPKLPVSVQQRIHPVLLHANQVLWDILATSPSYLDRLGIWEHVDWDRIESEPKHITATLNFQYSQALNVIPALFEFVILQKWKQALIQGKFNISSSNCEYWTLREKHAGVIPPSTRTNAQFDGFEAFSRDQQQKLSRFQGIILGFQLHRAICNASGQRETLQQCDITGNPVASKLVHKLLAGDMSRPWEDIVGDIIPSDNSSPSARTLALNVDAMLDYFEPLHHFLNLFNYENRYSIGWNNSRNSYASCE